MYTTLTVNQHKTKQIWVSLKYRKTRIFKMSILPKLTQKVYKGQQNPDITFLQIR